MQYSGSGISSSTRDDRLPRSGHHCADRVEVSDSVLRVWLLDGRTLTVPLRWLPDLADAPPEQRNEWRGVYGPTIWWPGLDMTVRLEDLLADRPPYPGCEGRWVSVGDVKVTDRDIGVWLADGRTLTVPLWWFPRLCDGTPGERDRWEEPGASVIVWPDLDEVLTTDGLLAGIQSGESATSLGRWLLARRDGRGVNLGDISHHHKTLADPQPLA